MRQPTRFLLLACMPAVLAACYSYTAVPITSVPVGTAVRARVSGAVADSLSQQLGHEEDRVVNGQLLATQGDAVLLSVPSVSASRDGSLTRTYQRVMVPQAGITEFEVRRLDRWKTGGLVALVTAVVGFVAVRQFGNESAVPGPGKGGSNK